MATLVLPLTTTSQLTVLGQPQPQRRREGWCPDEDGGMEWCFCDTCKGTVELPRDMWREHYHDGSRWVWKGEGEGEGELGGGRDLLDEVSLDSATTGVSGGSTSRGASAARPLVQRFYRTTKKVFEKHEFSAAYVETGREGGGGGGGGGGGSTTASHGRRVPRTMTSSRRPERPL